MRSRSSYPGDSSDAGHLDAINQRVEDQSDTPRVIPPMRMPRVRFTVRRMMVGVAVVAIGMGIGVEADRLLRIREDCLATADRHSRDELQSRKFAASCFESAQSPKGWFRPSEATSNCCACVREFRSQTRRTSYT